MVLCHTAHLTAQLAAKDALHKRGRSQLGWWLWLDVLQECLMHGIQYTAQVLMGILLPPQTEPAGARCHATACQQLVNDLVMAWSEVQTKRPR